MELSGDFIEDLVSGCSDLQTAPLPLWTYTHVISIDWCLINQAKGFRDFLPNSEMFSFWYVSNFALVCNLNLNIGPDVYLRAVSSYVFLP